MQALASAASQGAATEAAFRQLQCVDMENKWEDVREMVGPMMKKIGPSQIQRLWSKALAQPYSPKTNRGRFRSDGSSNLKPAFHQRNGRNMDNMNEACIPPKETVREQYERRLAAATSKVKILVISVLLISSSAHREILCSVK